MVQYAPLPSAFATAAAVGDGEVANAENAGKGGSPQVVVRPQAATGGSSPPDEVQSATIVPLSSAEARKRLGSA